MTAPTTTPDPIEARSPSPRPGGDPVSAARRERLRILTIVQAALATTAAVEASVFGLLGGGPPVPLVLTLVGAALTWWLAARLRNPNRRTFRLLRRLQAGWLFLGTIDLLLSLFLARRGLSLAAGLTRFALPVWVYTLARREYKRITEVPDATMA